MTISLQRNGAEEQILLDDCDLVMGVDPAASDKRVSTRTSRSAVAIIARSPKDDLIILDTRCDFVKPSKLFDWLFNLVAKYKHRIRQVRVEAQGPFKLLADVLRDEMKRRGEHFYLLPVPAMGDKVPTIKMTLEPFLKRDSVFVINESMAAVRLEFDVFPSSRLDLMDAIKIAVAGSHLPANAWHDEDDEHDEDDSLTGFKGRHVGVVGY